MIQGYTYANWRRLLEGIFPFLSDSCLRRYYLDYKNERHDFIKRKREVCQRMIMEGIRASDFQRKEKVLRYIDAQREKRQARMARVEFWLKALAIPSALATAVTILLDDWEVLVK